MTNDRKPLPEDDFVGNAAPFVLKITLEYQPRETESLLGFMPKLKSPLTRLLSRLGNLHRKKELSKPLIHWTNFLLNVLSASRFQNEANWQFSKQSQK